jgi:hypothetical protein
MGTSEERVAALDEHVTELTEQHADSQTGTPDDSAALAARLSAVETRLNRVEALTGK